MSGNLQSVKLKTADISWRYYWFPPQNGEFTHKEGRKKRTNVWQMWQGYYLCVFWWSSLNLLFSGLLQEDL